MVIFPLLLLVVAAAAAEQRQILPPLRVDLQLPEEYQRISTRNVITNYIQTPLDHFDAQNTATFPLRYMVNEEFFGGNDYPIFIFVGGEWSINAGWLQTGNLYELGRDYSGYLVYLEHRYYGQSLPFSSLTAANLRFLSVDQALADLAYFIQNLKSQPRFANSKVVLYGGSYAGNMAIWFKKTYPDIAVGAISSGGPILAEVDFKGYLEAVHDAFLAEGGQTCVNIIREGIADTVAAVQTQAGRRSLELAYRLCDPLDYDDPLEMGVFAGLISWTFSGAVQTARPGTIKGICEQLDGHHFGVSAMSRVGGYIANTNGLPSAACWTSSFEGFLDAYTFNLESRAWYYQTCTEFGYYQTAPTSGTVFDPLTWLSVPFYVEACQRLYDPSFTVAYVNAATARINQLYGGLNPGVNNTVNIHGVLDPWRRLGVFDQDLAVSSPSIDVPRASHCFDLQPWLTSDTIRMVNAKQDVRRIVARWLN